MQTARIIRFGGMLIGGILGSLLLAAFIVPPLLDWNEYRGDVEGAASSLLDKHVTIDGDLEVRLLPVPIVRVSGLRILDASQDKNIATVGSLDVAMSVMAMLSGTMGVTHLTLNELELSLIQAQSGAWSVEGLAGESENESDGASESLQLDDFRIKNSKITLVQSNGTVTDVSIVDMGVDGIVPSGPLNWSGSAAIHDVPLTLSGRMQSLSNGIDKSLSLAVNFAGSSAEFSGKLEQAGGFEGRLKVESENAAVFEQALYKLTQQPGPVLLPTEALELDARMIFSGSKGNIETKRFMLGSTTARAEVTFLGKGRQHFSGRLGIGAINLDEWQYLATNDTLPMNGKNSNKNNSLFGDIEVTVDSIQWHGEAVRQIEMAIGLNGETINITKLQALLPGGGTLSLGGKYLASDRPSFVGRVGLKTGGLRDLLLWSGVDISRLPADRLMSLNWRSAMILKDKQFQLANIEASLDDSAIKGSLAFAEDFTLSGVALDINKINLDAYKPTKAAEPSDGATLSAPEHIKISVGDLIINRTHLNNVKVSADRPITGLVAITGSAELFGGSVGLTGNVSDIVSFDSLNLIISGKGLNKSTLLSYMDKSNRVPRSLGGKAIDFTAGLEGTLDNLSVDASLKSESDNLSSKGSLSLVDNQLSELDMLGKLELGNSQVLLQNLGIEGAKGRLSLDWTAAGKMDGDLSLRLAGMVAGSELIAKGLWTNGAEGSGAFKGDINLALGSWRSLPASLQYMPALAGMRLKSDIDYSATLMAMNNIDIAIAGGRITGGIRLSGPEYKSILGNITADGVQFEDAASKPSTLSQPWSKQDFYPLPTSGMKGTLDLSIKSFAYKGQDVTDSNGKVAFTGNGLAFNFSQLMLNGAPAKFAVSITDDKGLRQFEMHVDATSIRMAPLLKSLTGSVVSEGSAKLSFKASGSGKSEHALVSSLKGQGKFHATAGTLKFLDVVKLAGVLRNPASGVSAIQSIGGMLGKGSTKFGALDGAMVMDKGIMNFTSIKGVGDWGKLNLSGPVNLVRQDMNLSGKIVLSQPQDVPEIGMSFTGPVIQPRKKFQTDVLLRYVLTKVNILRKQEAQDGAVNQASPAEELVGKAFDFLGKLKKKKEEEKRDN